MGSKPWRLFPLFPAATLALVATPARAEDATPGYPEPVVQWGVQPGDTCDSIAQAEYGSPKHAALVLRYNRVDCAHLTEGTTLVLPAKVTEVPTAHLKSMHPNVRTRPAGGAWAPGQSGQPLGNNHDVNTLDDGRADIEFADRSRVFLAPHTLVVIYGTAAKTKVTKTKPSTVELEEGEVRAGLAALRGGSVDVSIGKDATVSATSRDAVVAKKKNVATVSVFDGKAKVSSAGRSVEVPEKFGNKVVEGKPPTAPQPLPPAPTFGEALPPVELAPNDLGTLHATWSAVPRARAYRVEVARDPSFDDLLVRQEVTSDILAARIERMAPGGYFFRVRAIDADDFVGLPATRRVELVGASLGSNGGAIEPGAIDAARFATLALNGTPGLRVSLDDGTPEAAPKSLDLGKYHPKVLHLRAPGDDRDVAIPLVYAPPTAKLTATRDATGAVIARGSIDGVTDAARRTYAPALVYAVGRQQGRLPITLDGQNAFTLTLPKDARDLGVVDDSGTTIATAEPPPEAAPPPPPVIPFVGVLAPMLPPSPADDAEWIAPTARNGGSISGSFATSRSSDASLQGVARASGSVGAFSVDARVASRGSKVASDDGAWLGGRARFFRRGLAEAEGGVYARVGLPTSEGGAPTRAELGLAFGGVRDRLGWVADGGFRFRVASDAGRTPVPTLLGTVLVGATYDLAPWARSYLVVDGHGAHGGGFGPVGGGASLGAEVGTTIFGSLALRGSPFRDDDAHFLGMLTIGARSF